MQQNEKYFECLKNMKIIEKFKIIEYQSLMINEIRSHRHKIESV